MSKSIPGILYAFFHANESYQLWAFSIAPDVASDVQDAFNNEEWPQEVFDDIEEEYGTFDFVSGPCPEVHGLGYTTSEIDLDLAPTVMTAWRERFAEELGEDALGEIQMLMEGEEDDGHQFGSDLEVYTLYQG